MGKRLVPRAMSKNEKGQKKRWKEEARPEKLQIVQGSDGGGDDDDAVGAVTVGDDEEELMSGKEDREDAAGTASCFRRHFENILTDEQLNELAHRKCKFDWEIPVLGKPLSKWVGTGELLQEVNHDIYSDTNKKLHDHWFDVCKSFGSDDISSSAKFTFFSLCKSYRDIMHCNKKPFYLRGGEDSSIMDAYIMHALNHVYKTREIVIQNDAKLAKLKAKGVTLDDEDLLAYCDQGFTRPTILILLPLASIAYRVVKRLIQLCPLSGKAVEHMDRFKVEFGSDDADAEQTLDSKSNTKPADFQLLFGGNNEDHFMLGIKFTKRNIKLFSEFHSSDIIVASPLNLITKFGQMESDKEKDVDYLSSIEVVIVDHTDVMLMQNWSHVHTVFDKLNQKPSKMSATDITRIRQGYLNGHAQFYRQTILLGCHPNPAINSLFNRLCMNYEGKVKTESRYKGVLLKTLSAANHVYERFDAPSIVDVDDARLDYFSKKVYPKIKDSDETGFLIFISSYFEFIRVRNFLVSQEASLCMLNEYTPTNRMSGIRGKFSSGDRKIMLYTERVHFYYRYKIKGVKNLIIYSLPERKEFYPEIINMLGGSKNMTCNALFSRFDLLKLERIVGTADAKRMVSSDKSMFVFRDAPEVAGL